MGNTRPNADYLSQLASGEPHFVLRAEDPLAPEHVEAWAIEAELNGYPKPEVDEARRIARAMRAWRGMKKPRRSKTNKPRKTKPGRRRLA